MMYFKVIITRTKVFATFGWGNKTTVIFCDQIAHELNTMQELTYKAKAICFDNVKGCSNVHLCEIHRNEWELKDIFEMDNAREIF